MIDRSFQFTHTAHVDYSDPLCINRQLWSSVQFVLGGSKWSVKAQRQISFGFAFLLKLYHRRDEGNLAKGRIAFVSAVGSTIKHIT